MQCASMYEVSWNFKNAPAVAFFTGIQDLSHIIKNKIAHAHSDTDKALGSNSLSLPACLVRYAWGWSKQASRLTFIQQPSIFLLLDQPPYRLQEADSGEALLVGDRCRWTSTATMATLIRAALSHVVE